MLHSIPSDDQLPENRTAYGDEARRANAAYLAYIAEHDLRTYQVTPAQVRRILSSGSADPGRARDVMQEFFFGGRGLPSDLFDHGQLLGRDGQARVIIGHPYKSRAEVDDIRENSPLLRAVRGLNVTTHVGGREESYYGFGTIHIRIGDLS